MSTTTYPIGLAKPNTRKVMGGNDTLPHQARLNINLPFGGINYPKLLSFAANRLLESAPSALNLRSVRSLNDIFSEQLLTSMSLMSEDRDDLNHPHQSPSWMVSLARLHWMYENRVVRVSADIDFKAVGLDGAKLEHEFGDTTTSLKRRYELFGSDIAGLAWHPTGLFEMLILLAENPEMVSSRSHAWFHLAGEKIVKRRMPDGSVQDCKPLYPIVYFDRHIMFGLYEGTPSKCTQYCTPMQFVELV